MFKKGSYTVCFTASSKDHFYWPQIDVDLTVESKTLKDSRLKLNKCFSGRY